MTRRSSFLRSIVSRISASLNWLEFRFLPPPFVGISLITSQPVIVYIRSYRCHGCYGCKDLCVQVVTTNIKNYFSRTFHQSLLSLSFRNDGFFDVSLELKKKKNTLLISIRNLKP